MSYEGGVTCEGPADTDKDPELVDLHGFWIHMALKDAHLVA